MNLALEISREKDLVVYGRGGNVMVGMGFAIRHQVLVAVELAGPTARRQIFLLTFPVMQDR